MAHCYFDDQSRPILRSSFCMFLDVLGFNDLISEASKRGEASELLLRFSDALMQRSTEWKVESGTQDLMVYKCFTDNVVFGYIAEPTKTEMEFGNALLTALDHQLSMTLNGFFVRGGISFGDLHISNDLVFGQACLDAYETETRDAEFPRIALHQTAERQVLRHIDAYASVNDAPHNHTVLGDEDGTLFLNYLALLIVDESQVEWVARHRDIVTSKLELYHGSPRILRKYLWVARYHNYFVNSIAKILRASGHSPNDLKIAGQTSQNCKTFEEYLRNHPQHSVDYANKL